MVEDTPAVEEEFPFIGRTNGLRMMPDRFRRFTRGIAEECCKKSCSLNELRSYCR